MSEQPPVPPTPHDFPDHWGFYLLQAINRLDDKLDASIGRIDDKLETSIGRLDAKIDEVRREQHQTAASLHHDIQALDAKFDQKLTPLQYWYWGTLVVIIMGFITLFFTRP